MTAAYFVDTSALLPRYMLRAAGHLWMENLCDATSQNVIALSEISVVEIASALNQLARAGTIRHNRLEKALSLFWSHVDGGQFLLIPVSSNIVRRAAELCGRHSLKGYDAVQLACALAFRDDVRHANATLGLSSAASIDEPILLTEDNRLRDAGQSEGFTVDTPIAHP